MEIEFNKIFELYNKDIYRLIYSYTLDTFESKDILQETFLRFYKNINNISKEEIEIKKWLIRVATNISKDYLRKLYKHKTYIDDEPNLYITNPTFEIEFFELLKRLNKKYRIPIYLYYYEGYKIEEISNILKIKSSTIKMRLSRAKKFLKEEMEKL